MIMPMPIRTKHSLPIIKRLKKTSSKEKLGAYEKDYLKRAKGSKIPKKTTTKKTIKKTTTKKTIKNSGVSKSWYDRNVGTGGGFIPFKGVKRVSGKVKKGVKKVGTTEHRYIKQERKMYNILGKPSKKSAAFAAGGFGGALGIAGYLKYQEGRNKKKDDTTFIGESNRVVEGDDRVFIDEFGNVIKKGGGQ